MTLTEIGIIIFITLGLLISISIFFTILIIKLKYGKKFKNIEKIGHEAEIKINNKLSLWAKENNSIFIPNSLYKYNTNKIFEVDGILLTSRAIIIVEIKSMNGIIKGNTQESQWLKILGSQEHQFKSPVLQNQKHIDHILDMLNGKFPILSLIIFSNRVEKLDIKNELSHVLVIREEEIDQWLFNVQKDIEPKMNFSTLEAINKNLTSYISNSKTDYLLLKSFAEQK